MAYMENYGLKDQSVNGRILLTWILKKSSLECP
jgi:hypothetical protein